MNNDLIASIQCGVPRFADAVESLLYRLIAFCGDSPIEGWTPDGVVFEIEEVGKCSAFGLGIVHLLPHGVQPIRVNVAIDAARQHLVAGTLHCGIRNWPGFGHDSRDRLQLEKAILLHRREFECDWMQVFRWVNEQWNCGNESHTSASL